MSLRTEKHGDAIFIYSIEQEKLDEDVSAIGIASLRQVNLSNGSVYIDGRIEIKPHCPADEISEVKVLLLKHISR